MFWHGRGYGGKAAFFTMMKLYIVWFNVWVKFVYQIENGMSAVSYNYNLIFALFAVAFCNFYIVIWQVGSHDIDQSLDEKTYKFHMPDLYAYCRIDIQSFNKNYFYTIVASLIPSAIVALAQFDTEANGAIGESGWSQGWLMMGVCQTTWATLFHHAWLMQMTHNFDFVIVLWFIFSLMWMWLTYALEDMSSGSWYDSSIYPIMLKSPVFWLQVVLGLATSWLPIYFFFKYR